MSFDVSADAYGRFMGRFSERLAVPFVAWSQVRPGLTALDVGCGPGALTAHLVEALGADNVRAIDPSPSFVAAARERFPGMDIQQSSAASIPLPDNAVDRSMAQLVVNFMPDPIAGLREMARVTRPGGLVAACVWDLGPRGRAPISLLWKAVHDLDSTSSGEASMPGTREGQLAMLAEDAGLTEIQDGELTVSAPFLDFEDWWEPYTRGVGPAGQYIAGLDDAGRKRLRDRCRELLPDRPFEISATAWCVRGSA
ncbi:class I SAM-dependent methyltransferase [Flexivirga alba]|uniref:Class I SAM-dependent methyltransferase n=1 Tax=Flexivirga alba TaxID=702742 RepID=A0ABW2ABK2_9MICO